MATPSSIVTRRSSSRWLKTRFETLPLCRDRCRRWFIGLAWLGVGGVIALEYRRWSWGVLDWDLLLISGLAIFILGVTLASRASVDFRRCLTRLHDRGALRIPAEPFERLIDELEQSADRWARGGALFIALAMLIAFAVALSQEFRPGRGLLGAIEAAMGYVAGSYLGRMAFYGQLGWLLRRRQIEVVLDPWHVDHVGGLRPVGGFYFVQAMVVAIPAAFLAVWLLLIPIWPKNYSHWQEPYLGLLAIVILLEILAFVWPLWSFHTIMVEQKNRWRRDADRLYRAHLGSARALLEPSTAADKEAMKRALEIVDRCYLDVERLPTWPVDLRLRLRFALNNALLAAPLVIDLLHQELEWPRLLEFLLGLTA